MDEAAVQNINQESNIYLMDQITELISTKISCLKRSNEESSEEQLKDIKRLKSAQTPRFKKKSNKEQFKAMKSFLNTIEDAQFYLEKPDLMKT